ncbi:peptidoglycan-binding domain-containing protein [Leptolyngbya ectocarpi]|uniref:peptidoglycan-binding domain-containing protein n=1 Tax=Leptolyngbya ectocarpi TaxID=1202 RepID=UPI0018822751|nr:peptidoglycan-binding domain-containing protein [Leptolyngbya ectocarpi]
MKVAQKALNRRKYYVDGEKLLVDGYYWQRTMAAVQRFQTANDRKPTGKLNLEDFELLIGPIEVELKQPQDSFPNHLPKDTSSSPGSQIWAARILRGLPLTVGLLLLSGVIVVFTTRGYETQLFFKNWGLHLSPPPDTYGEKS